VRSTRSLRLTREGEVFLAHCRPALAALRDAQLELASGRQQVSGVLQLAAPSDFGRNLLLPWLEEFQQLHPGIQYRLHLSDRVTNVYSDLVDAAFRQGEPPDSSMLALPVHLTNRRVLCASPAYLKARGTPETPQAVAGTVACASCSARTCTTAGSSGAMAKNSRCAPAAATSPMTATWCACGRWRGAASSTNRGWMW
jgi:DNA-binding transcriptional LysR family regulator